MNREIQHVKTEKDILMAACGLNQQMPEQPKAQILLETKLLDFQNDSEVCIDSMELYGPIINCFRNVQHMCVDVQFDAYDSDFIQSVQMLKSFCSPEELERNTEILRISAAKYACSIKTLDMLQWEGFCSSLPLGRTWVNVSRFLSSERLAQFSPVITAENRIQSGAFYGLNAINDNLVILNRKQGIHLAGAIIGTERSGKMYQMKREILNALLTTNDNIRVVSCGTAYDAFIRKLSGEKITDLKTNPLYITSGYGLTKPDEQAKELFLSAYEQVKRMSNGCFYEESNTEETCSEEKKEHSNEQSRLLLYQPKNPAEYLSIMEHLWNQSIEDKKNNITNWIFLDGIDEFLTASHGGDSILLYLFRYLKGNSDIKNVVTVLVQDAVELMTTIAGSFALEDLLGSCGYVKLLRGSLLASAEETRPCLSVPRPAC